MAGEAHVKLLRSNAYRSAGTSGAVWGGVAGTLVAPGPGTAAGALIGHRVGQNKFLKQRGLGRAARKAARRTNRQTLRDSHGRFAGSK
jgi:hypothetical protein